MKKSLSFLLVLLLIFSLFSCDNGEESSSDLGNEIPSSISGVEKQYDYYREFTELFEVRTSVPDRFNNLDHGNYYTLFTSYEEFLQGALSASKEKLDVTVFDEYVVLEWCKYSSVTSMLPRMGLRDIHVDGNSAVLELDVLIDPYDRTVGNAYTVFSSYFAIPKNELGSSPESITEISDNTNRINTLSTERHEDLEKEPHAQDGASFVLTTQDELNSFCASYGFECDTVLNEQIAIAIYRDRETDFPAIRRYVFDSASDNKIFLTSLVLENNGSQSTEYYSHFDIIFINKSELDFTPSSETQAYLTVKKSSIK